MGFVAIRVERDRAACKTLTNERNERSVPTGIRRVVCEHNASSRAWGFVPIRVER
jgi:hypothetical protein